MLIHSHRHRKLDLELWQEYEQADLIHAEGDRLRKLVRRSLLAIRDFHKSGHCYCGVSWGKDSVVVADLCCRLGLNIPLCNLRVIPSRNPECDDVRDAFLDSHECDYREFTVDYSEIDRRSVTAEDWDKQTDQLWNEGWRNVCKEMGTTRYVSGIRADESAVRKLRCLMWGESSKNTCAPLAWWTDRDVFAYLAGNNLPVHPNYAMLGNGRWSRERLRTAEIGDTHGTGGGRREWEQEYYGDVLRRLESRK